LQIFILPRKDPAALFLGVLAGLEEARARLEEAPPPRAGGRGVLLLQCLQVGEVGRAVGATDGLQVESWTDRCLEPCARLIQRAYTDHVDSEINDQYRTEIGAMKFLRNIVLLPGCGQFFPDASFIVRPAPGEKPIGMVLTSTVAPGVGHTTQICVLPGYQKNGLGRRLMEMALDWQRAQGVRSVYLDATEEGRPPYTKLGFVGLERSWAVHAPLATLDLDALRFPLSGDQPLVFQNVSKVQASQIPFRIVDGRCIGLKLSGKPLSALATSGSPSGPPARL